MSTVESRPKPRNSKLRLVKIYNNVQELLEKSGGRVSIAKLAVELGYSVEYFKKSIVPALLVMSPCLRSDNHDIIWVCEGGE